jgi:hypothetical protein
LAEVVDDLQHTIGDSEDLALELVRWETHTYPALGPVQAVINEQVEPYDIFVGIFWKRFGMPTATSESGTVEEFKRAYARWQETGQPPVLFYFCERPFMPHTEAELDHMKKVLAFREAFPGLYGTYQDTGDFKRKVRRHLARTIRALIINSDEEEPTEDEPPGAASLSGAPFLVPFASNPDFVGRDEDLEALHQMIYGGTTPVGIRPTVLVGLGGIGKTQLPVEYAHAHREDYPGGVFWLNAANPLLGEFAGLAEKLGQSGPETPRQQAARAAWDYLNARPEALVIFDNVTQPIRCAAIHSGAPVSQRTSKMAVSWRRPSTSPATPRPPQPSSTTGGTRTSSRKRSSGSGYEYARHE